ncbi:hypothetical protein [Deinococcus planocerae]|uniref:hypothetical protein n=1 Tax=Deinococcus planocerae TaxID=1737569 RepID=UPI000C7EC865|nr:hypothetical protein [Deinococcus planocerae]
MNHKVSVWRVGRAGVLGACLGTLALVGCGGGPAPGASTPPAAGPTPPATGGPRPPGGAYACQLLSYYSYYDYFFG